MNLKDEIRKIVEVQELDQRLYSLRQEKDVIKPARLEEMKNEFERERQKSSLFEKKIKELQLKKKDKEIDLGSKEENLKKAQSQLYQLKTNKEYEAKLREISILKADISVAEEEVIKILDEIEPAHKDLEQEKECLRQEEGRIKEQEVKINNEIKDAAAQIENLNCKRKTLVGEIDKEILHKYEQLLKTRQGLAIVPVKGDNCGACHLLLTHQTINEIKMYENFVFCNNCVRILYMPEDI